MSNDTHYKFEIEDLSGSIDLQNSHIRILFTQDGKNQNNAKALFLLANNLLDKLGAIPIIERDTSSGSLFKSEHAESTFDTVKTQMGVFVKQMQLIGFEAALESWQKELNAEVPIDYAKRKKHPLSVQEKIMAVIGEELMAEEASPEMINRLMDNISSRIQGILEEKKPVPKAR